MFFRMGGEKPDVGHCDAGRASHRGCPATTQGLQALTAQMQADAKFFVSLSADSVNAGISGA